jgi:hypothetical protein
MLTLPPGVRVFVATARVDGRKGIDGLSALVRTQWAENPLSGSMYVFFSRRADRVRVLYFDRDGYVLTSSHPGTPIRRGVHRNGGRAEGVKGGKKCSDDRFRSSGLPVNPA